MFCSSTRKDLKSFFYDNVKKLLVPYAFFSIFGFFVAIVVALMNENSVVSTLFSEFRSVVWKQAVYYNAPLWFLLSLCFVRVFFNFARNSVNHCLLLIVSLSLAFAHYLFLAKYKLYWPGNLCSGLAFYILGMKLKELQYNKKIVVSSLIVLVTIGILKPTIVTMYGNTLLNENGIYVLWYPFCCAGIIIFNNVSIWALF